LTVATRPIIRLAELQLTAPAQEVAADPVVADAGAAAVAPASAIEQVATESKSKGRIN
jgi:hypothetical protein